MPEPFPEISPEIADKLRACVVDTVAGLDADLAEQIRSGAHTAYLPTVAETLEMPLPELFAEYQRNVHCTLGIVVWYANGQVLVDRKDAEEIVN